ncbi:MAG: CARDB domain-containing protein [Thermoplasmatota archaeon]
MFSLLLKDNLRSWLRLRGLALVLVACLVPPGLTAAWVFTHQADVSVADVGHDAESLVPNQLVNATATIRNEFGRPVGAFNVTLQIGYFENRSGVLSFRAVKEQASNVTGLPSHGETVLRMNWTAQPGTYIIRALADTDDKVAEIEERNNERYVQIQVRFPQFQPNFPRPPGPAPAAGIPAGDLAVETIAWQPDLFANQATTFQVDVANLGAANATNATLRLRIHQATVFGYSATPLRTLTSTFNLTAGNDTTVTLAWTPTQVGQFAFLATVEPGPAMSDGNASNDNLVQEAFIDRQFLYQEPEPKATAKDFYRGTLENLHLKILIPLVALFFAAGVIEDQRGSLAYLLTRPVPRWQIPVARYVAMMIVGSLALVAGIVATFILLLGLPQDASGYFYWPLLFGVACLAAYGALFTLMGVALRRPYLAGLVYVLGIETALYLGRTVMVNGRPLVQGWLAKLSLTQWMLDAFKGWNPARTGQWLPEGAAAMNGLGVMAAVAVVGLAAAAWLMSRREFEA